MIELPADLSGPNHVDEDVIENFAVAAQRAREVFSLPHLGSHIADHALHGFVFCLFLDHFESFDQWNPGLEHGGQLPDHRNQVLTADSGLEKGDLGGAESGEGNLELALLLSSASFTDGGHRESTAAQFLDRFRFSFGIDVACDRFPLRISGFVIVLFQGRLPGSNPPASPAGFLLMMFFHVMR